RAGYMKYLFDCDWMDPLLYDLMIDTSVITREHACELIIEAAHVKELVEARDRAQLILANHILIRQTEEALLKARQVNPRHISLSVTTPGVLRLTGIVNSEKEKLAAETVVRQVPGVRDVENDLYVTIAPIDHLDFA
ncbi:MAG: BON domain-containing protein, partial [Candidatus Entotheonellia bacterium]